MLWSKELLNLIRKKLLRELGNSFEVRKERVFLGRVNIFVEGFVSSDRLLPGFTSNWELFIWITRIPTGTVR